MGPAPVEVLDAGPPEPTDTPRRLGRPALVLVVAVLAGLIGGLAGYRWGAAGRVETPGVRPPTVTAPPAPTPGRLVLGNEHEAKARVDGGTLRFDVRNAGATAVQVLHVGAAVRGLRVIRVRYVRSTGIFQQDLPVPVWLNAGTTLGVEVHFRLTGCPRGGGAALRIPARYRAVLDDSVHAVDLGAGAGLDLRGLGVCP